MSRDSTGRVLTVAFILCVVCSILVSAAAVGLKSRQQQNKGEEKRKNILIAAGLYDADESIENQFRQIKIRIVDLETGEFSDTADSTTFDSRVAARDPQSSYSIPKELDRAAIKVRSRYMDVYLVKEENRIQQIILPVYGKGLWSTMYGFIALAKDYNTINGFAFYEHGETPGLGGEVDNPQWKGKWPGKKVYDPQGNIRIEILKGNVVKSTPDPVYKVDGLAGATLTARGVSNLLNYWMGDNGYKPFLDKLRRKGVQL